MTSIRHSLLRREWRLLFFGFALMFFSSPGQTFFVSLFGASIRSDLGLSHGEFGMYYSMATLMSALCLLKTGPMVDRFSMQRVVFVVAGGLIAACVTLALSFNVFTLFLAFLLLRHFGQGLFSTTSATAMMRYLPQNKGRANALSKMGFSAAEMIMPSIIVILLVHLGWRLSWLVIGVAVMTIIPLVVLIAAPKLSRLGNYETTSSSTKAFAQKQWTRAEVLRDSTFYFVMPVLLSQPMIYTGFLFHQVPLVDEKGWSLGAWGALYSLFAISSSVTLFVGGWLVDRVGTLRLLPWLLFPSMLALVVIWQADSLVAAGLFLTFMGVASGLQGATFAPFLAERYGVRHYAAIRSIAYFALVMMTAISPVLMGYALDHGIGFAQLAVSGIIYCGIATLAATMIRERI